MGKLKGHSIPTWYYLLTPAFIVMDYAVGVNVRVAALDVTPRFKILYYGICVVCGLAAFFRPRVSMVVAIFESSIIILLSLRSLLLPMMQVLIGASDLRGDWSLVEAFDLKMALNVVIAGTIGILAFRSNYKALTGRDVFEKPPD